MRLLLFFALFGLVSGCTGSSVKKSPVPIEMDAPTFLTKEEIVSEFKLLNENDVKDDAKLSAEDKDRLGHLIDEYEFFTDEQVKELIDERNKIPAHVEIKEIAKKEVDLRYRDTPIKSQDNGKCTSYAGVAGIENTLNRAGKSDLDLSEWHIWSKYRQYSCNAFIDAASESKIADEKYYPQYGTPVAQIEKVSHAKLIDVERIGSKMDKMMDALDRGNVVYLGMSTPVDMIKCKKVVSPYSGKTGGGHALLIVGYILDNSVPGKVVAILKNSWGADCADGGYQYVPLGHICQRTDFYCDMWEFKNAVSDKSSASVVAPEYRKVCVRNWLFFKRCYWEKISK